LIFWFVSRMFIQQKMFNKGDIVLIPFPFTDLSGAKLRPALVFHVYRDDLIVIFISSIVKNAGDCDMPIPKSEENGLKTDSILKLNKIVTLDQTLILGKIGKLEKDILAKANAKLFKMLSL